jgi:catechol 2,3-dioxygenase-like lactoylglutathione lyase family enzyme
MDQRVSFITLAVADVARTRAFYVDGLGWQPIFEADEVIMLPVADRVILSLWSVAGFTADLGGESLSRRREHGISASARLVRASIPCTR